MKNGGGYLNLVGGHFIDLANFLFENCCKIKKSEFDIYKTEKEDKSGNLRTVTADDQVLLELKYKNKIDGRIFISQMSNVEKFCFYIKGTEGTLKIENNEVTINKGKNHKIDLDYNEHLFSGYDNNLFTIGSYFLGQKIKDYLDNNQTFEYPDLKTTLESQKIIENAYKTLPNNV